MNRNEVELSIANLFCFEGGQNLKPFGLNGPAFASFLTKLWISIDSSVFGNMLANYLANHLFNYSYRNPSAGFLEAAFQLRKLTVNNAIPNANRPASANIHRLNSVL